ncbi:response regulator [Segetibacter sp.]|jgi:DNA-binding response OmpR family regulator|uniref:response regulator n=1 Tax=Segetibacter sp. TaxID=2231182 RepID=UPI002617520F|nr:response regulator [Segetibacter sp.]MCW3082157.1 transcriptional regulator [Segetibacter sp.]
MKVLFVQEQPFLATALQLTMLSKGFDLVVSEDTTHACSVMNQVNPNIVIADISNGTAICYVEEARKKNVPVIVISANGKETELQQAFDKGADDYMTLPVSLSELTLRVSILTRSLVA